MKVTAAFWAAVAILGPSPVGGKTNASIPPSREPVPSAEGF